MPDAPVVPLTSVTGHQKGDKDQLTRVVPGEELGEEGVVMCERLAGGSGSRGSATSSSKVGELATSLLSMVVDVLSNGACERNISYTSKIKVAVKLRTVGDRLVRSSGV
jgi:hypothetical protein